MAVIGGGRSAEDDGGAGQCRVVFATAFLTVLVSHIVRVLLIELGEILE